VAALLGGEDKEARKRRLLRIFLKQLMKVVDIMKKINIPCH
jgi:hypothetical protein